MQSAIDYSIHVDCLENWYRQKTSVYNRLAKLQPWYLAPKLIAFDRQFQILTKEMEIS